MAAASTNRASANVLLLDFGTTTPSNADGSSTLSPGAFSGAWSSATPTWNVIGDNDVNVNGAGGSLSYYDGTSAGSGGSGVGVDVAFSAGSTTMGPTTITFGNTTNQPTSSGALGGSDHTGIYANTSPITSAIWPNATIGTYQPEGVNITNLAAGTYTVYVTARNTNSSFTTPENVWINATNTTGAYTIPGGGTIATGAGGALIEENTNTENSGPFQANENYVVTTVTLSSGSPDLTIVTEGTNANEARGFLNSIEIVPTPEPTAAGLVSVLGSAFVALRRSRRAAV